MKRVKANKQAEILKILLGITVLALLCTLIHYNINKIASDIICSILIGALGLAVINLINKVNMLNKQTCRDTKHLEGLDGLNGFGNSTNDITNDDYATEFNPFTCSDKEFNQLFKSASVYRDKRHRNSN